MSKKCRTKPENALATQIDRSASKQKRGFWWSWWAMSERISESLVLAANNANTNIMRNYCNIDNRPASSKQEAIQCHKYSIYEGLGRTGSLNRWGLNWQWAVCLTGRHNNSSIDWPSLPKSKPTTAKERGTLKAASFKVQTCTRRHKQQQQQAKDYETKQNTSHVANRQTNKNILSQK